MSGGDEISCFMLRLRPEHAEKLLARARRVKLSPGVYVRELVCGLLDGIDPQEVQDLFRQMDILQDELSGVRAELHELKTQLGRYLRRANQVLENFGGTNGEQ